MQGGEKSRHISPVAMESEVQGKETVEGEKENEKESENESGNINDIVAEEEGTEGPSNVLESENVSSGVEASEAPGQQLGPSAASKGQRIKHIAKKTVKKGKVVTPKARNPNTRGTKSKSMVIDLLEKLDVANEEEETLHDEVASLKQENRHLKEEMKKEQVTTGARFDRLLGLNFGEFSSSKELGPLSS
ncbi:hypothetical protein A4A49_08895 [Nicotiana attenuata]|uniref:Uncharacterized protein n=1 Tax=Nicotiana attenuata TaxID=49451 RepID=A0A314KUD4_NICAT|nr:hypothetical protein A4A49_08895 [Nicotiana attenuata]